MLAILIGFVVGFWLYGVARTMRETVGFNATASLSGLFLGVVFPLMLGVVLYIANKVWGARKVRPISLLVAFVICLLVGSFTSEWWMLRDEAFFSTELTKIGPDISYTRSRAWPNQTCSLVFTPGKGIHSTD